MFKAVFDLLLIVGLLAAIIYNAKTGKITEWEEKHLLPLKPKFWKWLTRHINRMIRAYEMAHQEVRR